MSDKPRRFASVTEWYSVANAIRAQGWLGKHREKIAPVALRVVGVDLPMQGLHGIAFSCFLSYVITTLVSGKKALDSAVYPFLDKYPHILMTETELTAEFYIWQFVGVIFRIFQESVLADTAKCCSHIG
jgi:hypothetical protein